jgi:hypothetical protein
MTQLEPLAAVRERTIESLGRHFAQDHISLEELERRLEGAYRCNVPSELVALTHDLPAISLDAAGVAPASTPAGVAAEPGRPQARSGLAPDHQRMLCLMSSKKMEGYWEPPRHLDVAAIMSETVLDFTAARVPPVVEIRLSALMAQVRIIVPEGARVIESVSAFMAEIGNDAPWDGEQHDGPLIRVSGTAVMADVKVRLAPRRGRPTLRRG